VTLISIVDVKRWEGEGKIRRKKVEKASYSFWGGVCSRLWGKENLLKRKGGQHRKKGGDRKTGNIGGGGRRNNWGTSNVIVMVAWYL